MKNWITRLAVAHTVAFAGVAQASPIVEDFDYAAGSGLANQNGGLGWFGPWAAADTVSIAAGSLSYPGLTSSGNRAVFAPTNYASSGAARGLALGADGTTLWLSFLMRMDGNPDGMETELLFAPASGNYLRVGKVGGADTAWGVRRDGGPTVLSSTPITPGETALFVMRFDLNADPGADDSLSLWVDPLAGSDPGTPLATFSNNNFSSLRTFVSYGGFVSFSATAGAGTGSLDALRGGTSYADVAPAGDTLPSVPEPSSVALLALGLAMARAAVWRRGVAPNNASASNARAALAGSGT